MKHLVGGEELQMIKSIATIASFLSILFVCYIYSAPMEYKSRSGVCSPEVKAAIYKMGPGKDYRLFPDGRLEVSVSGKWMRLRY